LLKRLSRNAGHIVSEGVILNQRNVGLPKQCYKLAYYLKPVATNYDKTQTTTASFSANFHSAKYTFIQQVFSATKIPQNTPSENSTFRKVHLPVRLRGVRILVVRSLPTGPHWRFASFHPQFTCWSIRRSAGPHFTSAQQILLLPTAYIEVQSSILSIHYVLHNTINIMPTHFRWSFKYNKYERTSSSALILSETLALYKSFTYLLTYKYAHDDRGLPDRRL